MPIPEINYTWTFTSTGVGTRVDVTTCRELAFTCEAPAGSTAAFEILASRDVNSTSLGIVQGSSQAFTSSAGSGVVLGFRGPYNAVYPRAISLTSTGTLIVKLVGN